MKSVLLPILRNLFQKWKNGNGPRVVHTSWDGKLRTLIGFEHLDHVTSPQDNGLSFYDGPATLLHLGHKDVLGGTLLIVPPREDDWIIEPSKIGDEDVMVLRDTTKGKPVRESVDLDTKSVLARLLAQRLHKDEHVYLDIDVTPEDTLANPFNRRVRGVLTGVKVVTLPEFTPQTMDNLVKGQSPRMIQGIDLTYRNGNESGAPGAIYMHGEKFDKLFDLQKTERGWELRNAYD